MKILTGQKSEDVPVVSADPVPVISDASELSAELGPLINPPQNGGKRVLLANGKEMVAEGELLRQILLNGGTVIGDGPVQWLREPSIAEQRRQTVGGIGPRGR